MSGGPGFLRRPVGLALVAGVLAAGMVWLRLGALEGVTTHGRTYVRTFAFNSRPVEAALATGDGQAFAAIAMDPTLSRPEVFVDGAPEMAYRAQRPLAAYAAWLLSAGRPGLVAPALAGLFVLGQALAVGTAAALLRRRRGRPEIALLVVVLPPSIAALEWFGPEPLGLGLVLGGIVLWDRRTWRAAWAAAALLTLAALTRETNLVVPIGLGAVALARRDRPMPMTMTLATPALAWLGWGAVARARLGSWPWAAGACRVSETPLGGLLDGARHWPSSAAVEVSLVAVVALVALACLVLRPGDDLTLVAAGFAVLAAFMGDCVWRRWEDFSRPLLPLMALGLVVLTTRAAGPRPPAGREPVDAVGVH